jgi:hypothetical protein
MEERELYIEVIGPRQWTFGVMRKRGFWFGFCRETSFRNIFWWRLLVVSLDFPPVRYVADFEADE